MTRRGATVACMASCILNVTFDCSSPPGHQEYSVGPSPSHKEGPRLYIVGVPELKAATTDPDALTVRRPLARQVFGLSPISTG